MWAWEVYNGPICPQVNCLTFWGAQTDLSSCFSQPFLFTNSRWAHGSISNFKVSKFHEKQGRKGEETCPAAFLTYPKPHLTLIYDPTASPRLPGRRVSSCLSQMSLWYSVFATNTAFNSCDPQMVRLWFHRAAASFGDALTCLAVPTASNAVHGGGVFPSIPWVGGRTERSRSGRSCSGTTRKSVVGCWGS